MRGRRTLVLYCGCCNMVDFRPRERMREAAAEIQGYLSSNEEMEKKKHIEALIETKLIDDDDGLPFQEWFQLHLTFEPEIDPEIWAKYSRVRV